MLRSFEHRRHPFSLTWPLSKLLPAPNSEISVSLGSLCIKYMNLGSTTSPEEAHHMTGSILNIVHLYFLHEQQCSIRFCKALPELCSVWKNIVLRPRSQFLWVYFSNLSFDRNNHWLDCPCELKFGACHLPLPGLNHEPPQLLTCSTPWPNLRVENRSEALCAQGKLAEQVFR